MKASFLPKTRAGKWSVVLIIISVISIFIFNLGITGVEAGTPAAIAFGIVLTVTVFASTFALIKAVWKDKERSVLVFLLGLLDLLLLGAVILELVMLVFGLEA